MKTIFDIPKSWKYCLIITTLLIASRIAGYSQELSDTSFLKTLFIPAVISNENSIYLKNSESEMKVLFSFYFLIYKEYISSQDVDVCVFYPSCSKYTIEVIDKKGVIVGVLAGFDRLLRCHPYVTKGDYPYNKITMKYYDSY
jgi:putative membrane protein insertion efficiency factor